MYDTGVPWRWSLPHHDVGMCLASASLYVIRYTCQCREPREWRKQTVMEVMSCLQLFVFCRKCFLGIGQLGHAVCEVCLNRMKHGMSDRQTSWQIYLHTDRQAERQADIQAGRQTDIQTFIQTRRRTYIETYRQTYKRTDIQRDIQTGKQQYEQTDRHRQTDGRTDGWTDIQTDRQRLIES